MSQKEFCAQLYAWGIDIKPYIGVMITQEEYKQITGSDYVAGANA